MAQALVPYEIAIPAEDFLPLCKDFIVAVANGLNVIPFPYEGRRYYLTAEDYAVGWLLLDALAKDVLPSATVLYRISGASIMTACTVVFN